MSSLLCVVAHPDDETMLCGGTLARLAARGVEVHLLCLTRGEGGEMGEPPLCTRADLGQVREQELRCAAAKLGVRSVTFLGYVDPVVGPGDTLFAPEADFDGLVGQIAEALRLRQPDAVVMHGTNGEYGHPGHKLAHAATRQAAGEGRAPLLYSFSASYPAHPRPRLANVDDPADIVVDVSAWLNQKEAAALCHATQTALFVRRRSEAAAHPVTVREALLTEEAFHRHWPAESAANDVFLKWLTD